MTPPIARVSLAMLLIAAACTPVDESSAVDTSAAAQDTGRFVDSGMVLVAVVAPEIDEESGIVRRRVAASDGRLPILRRDTLYADAAALAAAIGADTAISLDGDRLRAGNRTLDVRGFRARGGIYAPVRSFARALGAFTYPERDTEGVTLFPRPVLEWLVANRERPDEVPVIRGAREQGLLPARRN